jgi:DNA mismatch repair protein MutL
MNGKAVIAQRTLFPVTFDLPPADAMILSEMLPDMLQLGYLIEPFGSNSFVIQGTPADVAQGSEKQVVESLIEQFKFFNPELKYTKREKLVRTLSYQRSVKAGKALTQKEMEMIVSDLFNCAQPNATPGGTPTYLEFRKDQIEKMFAR